MINLLDPNAVLNRMFDAEKFDDMLAYCKTLLEKDPADMLALQNFALALFYLERFSDAVTACDVVLNTKPSDVHALKIKIHSLEKLGLHEQVLDCCDILLRDDPSDTWALNSMGLTLNELDRHDEAVKFYDKTLALNNNDITALLNKASSLYHMKDYTGCIDCYDRAQVLEPKLAKIPVAKSRAFEKLGLDDEAFLAAQGVLLKDMKKIIQNAKKNKYTVFHQFCTDEFYNLKNTKSRNDSGLDNL